MIIASKIITSLKIKVNITNLNFYSSFLLKLQLGTFKLNSGEVVMWPALVYSELKVI